MNVDDTPSEAEHDLGSTSPETDEVPAGLNEPAHDDAEGHDEATHAAASPVATHVAAPSSAPAAEGEGSEKPVNENMRWYIVKIASNREESIKNAIIRRVKIEGLQEFFGEIVVPTEKVTEMVKGRRVIKSRKLFPGYLMAFVEFNDRILYLFRETSGVGDFVGGAGINKPPTPMPQHEVDRLLQKRPDKPDVQVKPKFSAGENVRVKDGTFAGMEGVVKEILEAKGAVVVNLTIFGRDVPVELEYWQVDYA